ncbi:MAG: ATP synthase F1 subunit epsilon [Lachnospiraceae bacterium]|jgi:F-type H+-transporting ATPase subunit epsilon|nr:ATP synthase F1 subunit epsilon [Lachnospiraceae bacterium]
MADVMKLNVITPEKQFYEGEVTMVELTTTEGNIGVYPNHIPLTAVVSPGVLTIHEEGEKKQASLISGFITILPDSVTIMAEVAEWPDEIDFKRAEEARARAERRLTSGETELDTLRAEMALKRALVRLGLKH